MLIVNEASLSFMRKSVRVAFKTIQELDNLLMLDDTRPYIAMGGNIYPANGFKFDRGEVVHRSIPKGLVTPLTNN